MTATEEAPLAARTRRIWNQHTYHITNIGEDGKVPLNETPNWTRPGLDNDRQSRQPGNVFAAPDAVVSVSAQCGGTYGILATVRNLGVAPLPPGVAVGFYEGDPTVGGTLLGSGMTTKALYAAEAENVVLLMPDPPAEIVNGTATVYAVVDDGSPDRQQHVSRDAPQVRRAPLTDVHVARPEERLAAMSCDACATSRDACPMSCSSCPVRSDSCAMSCVAWP